jgi:hypothetical protein
MKKRMALSLTILVFSSILLQSQSSLGFGYQRSETWESIQMNLKNRVNKHSFELGANFGFNASMIYDQNNVFKRRFYGTNILEQFSFLAGYEYKLFDRFRNWHTSFFYSFTFSNAPAVSRAYILSGLLPDGTGYYVIEDIYLQKMSAFENYFGLNFYFQVMPQLQYVQKVGIGYTFFTHVDPKLGNGTQGEESSVISFGLEYSFKPYPLRSGLKKLDNIIQNQVK